MNEDVIQTKRCTKCGKEKPYGDFGSDRSRRDGKFPWCRPCQKVDRRRRYRENPKPHIDGVRLWQLANPDKIKAIKQRNAEKHRERYKEGKRQWAERNSEKVKKTQLLSRERNADKIIKMRAKYKHELVANMSDPYIKSLIIDGDKTPGLSDIIPTSLIEAKREVLRIKRQIRKVSSYE